MCVGYIGGGWGDGNGGLNCSALCCRVCVEAAQLRRCVAWLRFDRSEDWRCGTWLCPTAGAGAPVVRALHWRPPSICTRAPRTGLAAAQRLLGVRRHVLFLQEALLAERRVGGRLGRGCTKAVEHGLAQTAADHYRRQHNHRQCRCVHPGTPQHTHGAGVRGCAPFCREGC